MNRFWTLVAGFLAVIVVAAVVSGPASAAQRYVFLVPASTAMVCAGDTTAVEPFSVKPCRKKTDGQAVSCSPVTAFLPEDFADIFFRPRQHFSLAKERGPKTRFTETRFRPPRSGAVA